MSQDNSYSRIFKGTLIFGGTEVIKALIKIIRGKIVSVLLGPKGMGLSSIYTSSTQIIISLSSMGLASSAVRNISEATATKSIEQQRDELSLISQCFYITYAVGFLLTLLLCPFLSVWSFGGFGYTWMYALLSFYVLFELSCSHFTAILQGMGLIKELASATIYISIATLIIAIPLYYFFGIGGIVPAMVLGSMASAYIRFLQVRKLNIPIKWHPIKEIKEKAGLMITIGLISLVSVFFNTLVTYLINVFITRFGSIEDVGFFSAANVIVLQSVALVFSSMSADYYPRLSKVANDRTETNIAVNRQAEILCYVSIPILGVLVVTSPILIRVLLSSEFLGISSFIKWICLGTAFQVFSYPLGHIAWAKGDKKVLLFYEGIYNSLARLIIYVISYYVGGLEGLGYGICLTNFLCLIVVSLIVNKRYGYVRDRAVKLNFIYMIPLVFVVLLSSQDSIWYLLVSIIIVVGLCLTCIGKLNQRIGFFQYIKKRIDSNK